MTLSKEEIAAIDKLYYDPAERAQGVYNIITEAFFRIKQQFGDDEVPAPIDLIYFALEYLSKTVLGLQNDELIAHMREVSLHFYTIHYNHYKDLYGKPDKPQE